MAVYEESPFCANPSDCQIRLQCVLFRPYGLDCHKMKNFTQAGNSHTEKSYSIHNITTEFRFKKKKIESYLTIIDSVQPFTGFFQQLLLILISDGVLLIVYFVYFEKM